MQPGVPPMVPDWRTGMSKPSEMESVKGQLHLVEVAARSEDAQVGDHPAARADQGQGFLRRELILLIQPLHRRQPATGSEQRFHGLRREVAVAGADVDDQRMRRQGLPRCRPAEPLVQGATNLVFDLSATRFGRGERHGGSGPKRGNPRFGKPTLLLPRTAGVADFGRFCAFSVKGARYWVGTRCSKCR
jgi:hypothetical protein